MREGHTPADVIESVYAREPILDQWQAQILSGILDRVNVKVYTEMDKEEVRACKLQVIPDLNKAIHETPEVSGYAHRPIARWPTCNSLPEEQLMERTKAMRLLFVSIAIPDANRRNTGR